MMQQFFITDKNILNLFFLIYDEYEAYLKRDNLLDFEDLLNYTIKLFQECPDVLTK
jgi:superfamily I DNA/RNA helicase